MTRLGELDLTLRASARAPGRGGSGKRAGVGATDLKVVLYHHLTATESEFESGLHVSTAPAVFEQHIEHLAKDYDVVDLDTVLSGRLPRRALLITFDDGYRSVLDKGLQFLTRKGLPSVFFLSEAFLDPGVLPTDNLMCFLASRGGVGKLADAVGGVGASASIEDIVAHVSRLPYIRREHLVDSLTKRYQVDLAEARRRSGLFLDRDELPLFAQLGCEVANHTRSHVRCQTITNSDTADAELVEHKLDLERWSGIPVRAFSYPYGCRADATPMVESTLARTGHEATFLVESRSNRFRRPGTPWSRVSLHNESKRELRIALELLPPLRNVRDFFRTPR